MSGSYSAWKVESTSPGKLHVAKVTDVLEAAFLNGIETLPMDCDEVMIADSGLGVEWKLDG